ncbi:MAG: hypothetical protein EP343_29390 [Deltaproteobacteria bacterium]|nr:MAG: hypothetical protein EP343_29390 [Deltaproteobacteria bacterium]
MRCTLTVRYSLLLLLSMSLSLVVCTGCVTPACRNARLSTQGRPLRGLWNSLQNVENSKRLEVWVSRFLDRLLAGTSYQLKEEQGQFIVVSPSGTDRVCRVNVAVQKKQLKDPKFLSRLLVLKNKYNLRMKSYLYTPAKVYTSEGNTFSTTGGNCNSNNYRVDFTYWKSISTKYSQTYWKEACKLGKKLKKWDICFPPKLGALYRKRMKMICK